LTKSFNLIILLSVNADRVNAIPNKYYESRKRWNSENYKQLNLSVNPALIESFKAACEKNGASMRKVLTEHMATYASLPSAVDKPKPRHVTRGDRRKAVRSITSQLTAILDAEEQYRDGMPENLKNSARHESAEQTCETLEEAIGLLGEAFE
jgi:hypothetical protein